jgi:hypothetical protein
MAGQMCDEPARESQVQEHLGVTEKVIAVLRQTVDGLEERLSPVLIVEPVAPPTGKAGTLAQVILAPTANRLREIHGDISSIVNRLADIRRRVEA